MLQLRANQGYLTWFTNKLGTRVLFFPFFSLGHGPIYENKPWTGHKYSYPKLKQKQLAQKQLVLTGAFLEVLKYFHWQLLHLAYVQYLNFRFQYFCTTYTALKRHLLKPSRHPGVHIRSPTHLYKSQLLFSWSDTAEKKNCVIHHDCS